MSRFRLSKRWLVGCLLGAAALGLFAQQLNSWERYEASGEDFALDLAQPDALIRSSHLARLPRDLLRVPLLKDLLDEEFVFYYEQNAQRMGLVGTLRRIAYEHELDWSERIVAEVLDEPAEVALWRDDKGALRRFAIVLKRNALGKIVEQAATVALKDKQLKLAGSLAVGDAQVKAFSLDYAPRRTLLIASHGERMVVLSHAGMLIARDGAVKPAAAQVVAGLLDASAQGETFFTRHFAGSTLAPGAHQLMIGANTLSLGYQHFFPGLQALRFDFDAREWSTHVRLEPQQLAAGALDSAQLWRALPAAPAACAMLPVDWRQAGAQLRERAVLAAGGEAQLDALLANTLNGAAACWYGDASLSAPLFIARMQTPANADAIATARQLFGWSVGQSEDVTQSMLRGAEAQLALRAANSQGAKTATALALARQYVLFSSDARLVERAAAAIEQRHPNLLETLPEAARTATLATLQPKALAALVWQEAEQTLKNEPVLAQAIARQLHPRLDKVAKYGAYALLVKDIPSSGAAAWLPVTWLRMPGK